MFRVMRSFVSGSCLLPVAGGGCAGMDIGAGAGLELFDGFFVV